MSSRIARVLLKLYPRPVRDRYGRELLTLQADLRARGELSRGRLVWDMLAGSLESLWLVDVNAWAQKVASTGAFPDRDHRLKNHEQHVQIVEAIADGDAALAVSLAESHFDPARFHLGPGDAGRRVDASAMHTQGGNLSPGMSGLTDGS